MEIQISIKFLENNDNFRLPVFYMLEESTPWDLLEIHPVKQIEQGIYETCDEGEEDFWSVYIHKTGGDLICVADLKTKSEAKSLSQIISNCSNTRIHHPF